MSKTVIKKTTIDFPERYLEVINLVIKGEATYKGVEGKKDVILKMIAESPTFQKYSIALTEIKKAEK